MANVAYLPNVAPSNNNTAQIRRRANQTVTAVNENSTAITVLQAQIPTLAPIAAPSFTGTVTQEGASVLTAATTATSATAGSASSLPATPVGYLEMSINGQTVKLPYYAP